MSYNTIITAESTGEIVVKKSRFIAALRPVSTEQEAAEYIKSKKKQYHDARHNCSCYIIGRGDIEKSSDDGEPSGTAGRPMHEVLSGRGIYNVVCVVTRYFGGVLLGTGGLVRAYQDAVKAALESADLATTYTAQLIKVTTDYTTWPKLEAHCRSNDIPIADVTYTDRITATLTPPVESTNSIVDQLTDASAGKAMISLGDIVELTK